MSSGYSNRSGDPWDFGNGVMQLSFGGDREVLGVESREWLLRISDQPGIAMATVLPGWKTFTAISLNS